MDTKHSFGMAFVAALLVGAACLGGCGSGGSHSASSEARQAPRARAGGAATSARAVAAAVPLSPYMHRLAEWDHDNDAGTADEDKPHSLFDGDDREVTGYGHLAGASDRRAVAALIARYYNAAAAGDGAVACAQVDAGLTATLVAQAAAAPGAPAARSRTCAGAITKMFADMTERSAADRAGIRLVELRIRGEEGLAVLQRRQGELRDIPVSRESGAWKLEAFFDSSLT